MKISLDREPGESKVAETKANGQENLNSPLRYSRASQGGHATVMWPAALGRELARQSFTRIFAWCVNFHPALQTMPPCSVTEDCGAGLADASISGKPSRADGCQVHKP